MKLLAAALLLFLLSGCATVPPAGSSQVEPGYQPSQGSDEANLWYATQQFEADLKQSPAVVRDPVLTQYVSALSCKLAGSLCPDIRVYVLRAPYFNAFMAPNGLMVVYTGLLLRAENEADLAFVLAHEIGHYQAQHALKNWRKTKNAAALTMGVNLVSGGVAGVVTALGAGADLAAFSRDQEREADQFGLDALAQHGYALDRPAAFWRAIYDEDRVNKRGLFSAIFASHPATLERAENLRRAAQARTDAGGSAAELGLARYQTQIAPFRRTWLADELARRNYAQTDVLLARLYAASADTDVRLARAEMYRKRNQPGDLLQAVAAYQAALTDPSAPAEAHRDLGLTLRKLARHDEARAAYRRYLALAPEASDRAMFEHYLNE